MRAIYKRELRSYFTGFTGYLFLALMQGRQVIDTICQ